MHAFKICCDFICQLLVKQHQNACVVVGYQQTLCVLQRNASGIHFLLVLIRLC